MAADKTSQIAQCIASGSGAPANEGLGLAVAVFAFMAAGMWMYYRFAERSAPAPELQPASTPALAPAPS